jgi:hypothetical protein
VPEFWGGSYGVVPRSVKGTRKRDEKLDSCAAKKGAKKLVSSNCSKILETESRGLRIEKLVRKQCQLPLIQKKLLTLLLLLSDRNDAKLLAIKMTLVHVI